MSLAEIYTGNATRQDVKINGTLFCDSVVATVVPSSTLLSDGFGGEVESQYQIVGGVEAFTQQLQWAAWSPSVAYPSGAVVRYLGATWGRTAGGPSTPGAVPSAPNGWTQSAVGGPLSTAAVNALTVEASPVAGGSLRTVIGDNPAGPQLQMNTSAAGLETAQFGGEVSASAFLWSGPQAGVAIIPLGADTIAVADTSITAASVVVATCYSAAGAGVVAVGVDPTPGVGFSLNTAAVVAAATSVAYVVLKY